MSFWTCRVFWGNSSGSSLAFTIKTHWILSPSWSQNIYNAVTTDIGFFSSDKPGLEASGLLFLRRRSIQQGKKTLPPGNICSQTKWQQAAWRQQAQTAWQQNQPLSTCSPWSREGKEGEDLLLSTTLSSWPDSHSATFLWQVGQVGYCQDCKRGLLASTTSMDTTHISACVHDTDEEHLTTKKINMKVVKLCC